MLRITTLRKFVYVFYVCCNCVFPSLVLFSLIFLLRPIRLSECLIEHLIKGPIRADDAELMAYIMKEVLIPPSTMPYNLLGRKNPANGQIEDSEKFYANFSKKLFNNKRQGFFVEAGALDGESMSTTLQLEIEMHWTGILIEPDPKSFQALLGKHRKAWAANVCLSPYSYPSKEVFAIRSQYVDPRLGGSPLGFKMRSMHGLTTYRNSELAQTEWHTLVQCLPLESLLGALRIKRVDVLSLDVEGVETKMLKNFPFGKYDIQVIFLEWKDRMNFDEFVDFMRSHGFTIYDHILDDYIFMKNDSIYL